MRSLILALSLSLIFGCDDPKPATKTEYDLVIHTKSIPWQPKAHDFLADTSDIGYELVRMSKKGILKRLGGFDRNFSVQFDKQMSPMPSIDIEAEIKIAKFDKIGYSVCNNPQFKAQGLPEVRELLQISKAEIGSLKFLGEGSYKCVYQIIAAQGATKWVLKIPKFDGNSIEQDLNDLKRELILSSLFEYLANHATLVKEKDNAREAKRFLEGAKIYYTKSSLERGITWQLLQEGADPLRISYFIDEISLKETQGSPEIELKSIGFGSPLEAFIYLLALESFYEQTNNFVKDYLIANGVLPYQNPEDSKRSLGFDFGLGRNQIFDKAKKVFIAIDF